jgi:hypothetical protein
MLPSGGTDPCVTCTYPPMRYVQNKDCGCKTSPAPCGTHSLCTLGVDYRDGSGPCYVRYCACGRWSALSSQRESNYVDRRRTHPLTLLSHPDFLSTMVPMSAQDVTSPWDRKFYSGAWEPKNTQHGAQLRHGRLCCCSVSVAGLRSCRICTTKKHAYRRVLERISYSSPAD